MHKVQFFLFHLKMQRKLLYFEIFEKHYQEFEQSVEVIQLLNQDLSTFEVGSFFIQILKIHRRNRKIIPIF
jgi:hypothetical protein